MEDDEEQRVMQEAITRGEEPVCEFLHLLVLHLIFICSDVGAKKRPRPGTFMGTSARF